MSIINLPLKKRGDLPMVNSISSVNGATPSTSVDAVSKTTSTEKTAKQEEAAKKSETDKKQGTEKTLENKAEKNSANAFDRAKILSMVEDYIERLKKQNDYPMVQSRLDSYLSTFDVDKFMKNNPNITTEHDFNSIMYNETSKYL